MNHVIVLTGFPASGKTTAKDTLENEGYVGVSTGDIVREMAAEDLGKDVSELGEDETGKWSTQKREDDEIYATREGVNRIMNQEQDTFVVEGIRCQKEIEYLKESFDDCVVVFLHASREERLKRKTERNRSGEETTLKSLKERDEREKKWGLKEIVEEELWDVHIDTECSIEEFEDKILELT